MILAHSAFQKANMKLKRKKIEIIYSLQRLRLEYNYIINLS